MSVQSRKPKKRRVTLEISEKIDSMVIGAMMVSGLSLSDIVRQCVMYALPRLYPPETKEKEDLQNVNEN